MQFIQAFFNPFSPSLLSQSSKTAQGVRCGTAVGRGRIVKQLASWDEAMKRPRTRSTAARQVGNAHERDLVTNQNV